MKIVNLVIIAVGFYLTILLTPVIIRYCIRRNILDHPGGRKLHSRAVPRLGGVGMFIAFLVAEVIGFLFYPGLLKALGSELLGITIGLFIIFFGGLLPII